MGWRLTDLSIRARLYALLGVAVLGTATLLGLALYALNEFRVNGPRHSPIKAKRLTQMEVSPNSIYLSELYLTLQEMETAKSKELLDSHQREAAAHIAAYKEHRDAAIERLTDVALRRRIEGKLSATADVVLKKAAEFLDLVVPNKDGSPRSKEQQERITDKLREISEAFRAHRKEVIEDGQGPP